MCQSGDLSIEEMVEKLKKVQFLMNINILLSKEQDTHIFMWKLLNRHTSVLHLIRFYVGDLCELIIFEYTVRSIYSISGH